jgi:hypothetical protein
VKCDGALCGLEFASYELRNCTLSLPVLINLLSKMLLYRGFTPKLTAPRKAIRPDSPTVKVIPSRNFFWPLCANATLSKWIRSPRVRSRSGLGIIT